MSTSMAAWASLFGRRKRVVANGVSIGRKPTLTIIGNKRRYRALIPARGFYKKVIQIDTLLEATV